MKKSIWLIVFILSTILVVGCVNKGALSDKNPKEIIEYHFRAMNEKNSENYLKTLSERQKNNQNKVKLDSIENVEVISIDEEPDSKFKEGYLNNGGGRDTGLTEDNVKVYKVKFDVKYKEGANTAQDSGTDIQWFYVIKENGSTQWVIDDNGY